MLETSRAAVTPAGGRGASLRDINVAAALEEMLDDASPGNSSEPLPIRLCRAKRCAGRHVRLGAFAPYGGGRTNKALRPAPWRSGAAWPDCSLYPSLSAQESEAVGLSYAQLLLALSQLAAELCGRCQAAGAAAGAANRAATRAAERVGAELRSPEVRRRHGRGI